MCADTHLINTDPHDISLLKGLTRKTKGFISYTTRIHQWEQRTQKKSEDVNETSGYNLYYLNTDHANGHIRIVESNRCSLNGSIKGKLNSCLPLQCCIQRAECGLILCLNWQTFCLQNLVIACRFANFENGWRDRSEHG